MTSECEGKIVQIPNNQTSSDTASTLHNAHVDILLDEHDDTGQSLQNDTYGSENIPSSLLNALFPLNESSATNLSQTEDNPISPSSNTNQSNLNVNSSTKTELENLVCDVPENSTHSEPKDQTNAYEIPAPTNVESENAQKNSVCDLSENSAHSEPTNRIMAYATPAFEPVESENVQKNSVCDPPEDSAHSEPTNQMNVNSTSVLEHKESENGEKNSVCDPSEDSVHSKAPNSMSVHATSVLEQEESENKHINSVCDPAEDSVQLEPTNCMNAHAITALEHSELEKSQETSVCHPSDDFTHSEVKTETDANAINDPALAAFDKVQIDLLGEPISTTQEQNNSRITNNPNSEAIMDGATVKEPEISNEDIAVNKLLEALKATCDETSEIDSKDTINLEIETGISAEQAVDIQNVTNTENEFGAGISVGMMDVLNSLDPISSTSNDEEKGNNLDPSPNAAFGADKGKELYNSSISEIVDSDLHESDKEKDNIENKEAAFGNREDEPVAEAIDNKEKFPVEIPLQDDSLGENAILNNQSLETSTNSDDIDNEAKIKLQELLQVQDKKTEEESDFDDINFKVVPTVIITQHKSENDEVEPETDVTADQQSASCVIVEPKVQIENTNNTEEKNEWNQVDTVEVTEQSTDDETEAIARLASPIVKYKDAERECRKLNWLQYSGQVKTTVNKKGFFATVKSLFCGPPSLNKTLEEDRLFIFCMAAYQFDNNCETHLGVLQTIFKLLTGSRFDCSRYGNHWENIGFQGTDPSTDLRGTGFLGLLQILYLMTTHVDLGHKIYKLSLHETQNFPFCVMSINITRMCLQVLREGLINKESNIRKLVFPVFNNLYAGTFKEFYTMWKLGGKTIKDSGFVLKDLEANLRKQKDRIMSQVDASTKSSDDNDDDAPLEFFNVCEKD